MPKFFYRIEHKKSKIGPYRHDLKNGKSFYFVMDEQLDYDQFNGSYHRLPYQDKLGEYVPNRLENDARFGFVSLSQLKKWWGTDPKVYNLFKKIRFCFVPLQSGNSLSFSPPSGSHDSGA